MNPNPPADDPAVPTILREPRVYLVGRQSLDDNALAQFLTDHEASSWTTDTEIASQKLIEVAGRLCYMSFRAPRPGGNSAYIGHLLDVGHGSVLEHAVFNFILTGVSRSFTHELIRHRAGFGYCLAGNTQIECLHRSFNRRGSTTTLPIASLFAMQSSPEGRTRLQQLRPRCLDESTGELTSHPLRQVAYSGRKPVYRTILDDGRSIDCSKDHRFLTRNGWQSLESLVGGLRVHATGRVEHGPLASAELAVESLSHQTALPPPAATRRPALLGTDTTATGKTLAPVAVDGPGSNPEAATATLAPGTRLDRGRPHLAAAPAWSPPRPRLLRRNETPALDYQRIARIEYLGLLDTYDLEMQAPHHNFLANGIITHNSQLSQRFVDESSCEFVEPDVIASDPELHAVWLDAMTHAQHAYKRLADALAERFKDLPDRTLRRKKAREAARSVLPNATETRIFVTANARALRHFIEMRGDPAADVEIRKVALAMLQVLQVEAPNLFGDYRIEPLPEGGHAARTEHRKV